MRKFHVCPEKLKNAATAVAVFGMVMAAFGFQPVNNLIESIGMGMWAIVGIMQKDAKLTRFNLMMTVLCVLAFLNGGEVIHDIGGMM